MLAVSIVEAVQEQLTPVLTCCTPFAVRVSPLALGSVSPHRLEVPLPEARSFVPSILFPALQLNFGQAWAHNMGASALGPDAAMEILDAYVAAGGNFIDTANGYQAGGAESVLGQWFARRGNRDQIVLSSKYSMNFDYAPPKDGDAARPIRANSAGNSIKSLRLSVKDSLAKLGTE